MSDSPVPVNISFTVPNGPLITTGDLHIDTGAETLSQPKASFCRCGASARKPFCDGSHKTSGFADPGEAKPSEPVAELTESGPVTFSMIPNGPLIANGPLTVQNAAKEPISAGVEAALCRCGHSANKPYCDGSHNAAGFIG